MSKRFRRDTWGRDKERQRTSPGYWQQPIAWNRAAALASERHRVFCASMADVFDAEVPMQWRIDLLSLIEKTPSLDWLILTKSPQNIYLSCFGLEALSGNLQNVWLGASVEDQKRADERIPTLLKIPATVHFLSVEPLLAPIDLGNISHIEWVIVGGESGPRARPMNPEWALAIRDQCLSASVPFFFKQWGGRTPKSGGRKLGGRTWDQMP